MRISARLLPLASLSTIAPMTPELRPIIAGKYAIEWEVDAGAMGRVLAATQLGLDRPVAVKIMSESSPEFRQRFLVEAHSMARLNHRNIVTIYDSGETADGLAFIVMEYLRGRTLADAIKAERRFEPLRALHIATQVTRGLRAAHRQGIVHRDLKPSNIFLVDDDDDHEVVKVFDFGIAKTKALTEHHVQTRAGVIIGTPAFMAPEQIEGRDVDARTDLYALGVVLYQLLTGRTPFIESSQMELLLAHLRKEPRPLRSLCSTVPADVEALVLKLLSKSPSGRYADTDDLLVALGELMVSIGGEAYRPLSTDVFGGVVPFSAEAMLPHSAKTERLPARAAELPLLEPLPRTYSPSPRTPRFLPALDDASGAPTSSFPARRERNREQLATRIALAAILAAASVSAFVDDDVMLRVAAMLAPDTSVHAPLVPRVAARVPRASAPQAGAPTPRAADPAPATALSRSPPHAAQRSTFAPITPAARREAAAPVRTVQPSAAKRPKAAPTGRAKKQP